MMSSFRFLTLHLLLLLLTAVCDAQYDDFSPTPDYDADDNNLTIEYTFYSNTSSDELETFLDSVGGEDDATKPTELTELTESTEPTELTEPSEPTWLTEPTEKSLNDLPGSKPPPDSGSRRVYLELTVLIWTPMILMVLS